MSYHAELANLSKEELYERYKTKLIDVQADLQTPERKQAYLNMIYNNKAIGVRPYKKVDVIFKGNGWCGTGTAFYEDVYELCDANGATTYMPEYLGQWARIEYAQPRMMVASRTASLFAGFPFDQGGVKVSYNRKTPTKTKIIFDHKELKKYADSEQEKAKAILINYEDLYNENIEKVADAYKVNFSLAKKILDNNEFGVQSALRHVNYNMSSCPKTKEGNTNKRLAYTTEIINNSLMKVYVETGEAFEAVIK